MQPSTCPHRQRHLNTPMSAARWMGFGNESRFAPFSNSPFGAVFPFMPGAPFQWADESRKLGWGYVFRLFRCFSLSPRVQIGSFSSHRTFSALGMNGRSIPTKADVSDSGATMPIKQIPEHAAKTQLLVGRVILRKDELARALNMSPRSIQNLMRRKAIPFYQLSSRFLRFDLSKVRAALDNFEVKEIGRGQK